MNHYRGERDLVRSLRARADGVPLRFSLNHRYVQVISHKGKYELPDGRWVSLYRLRKDGYVLTHVSRWDPDGTFTWEECRVLPPNPRVENARRLRKLLAKARKHTMTDEARQAQRISFAYGNVAMSNPNVTIGGVVAAAARILTEDDARQLLARYRAAYPKVVAVLDQAKEQIDPSCPLRNFSTPSSPTTSPPPSAPLT